MINDTSELLATLTDYDNRERPYEGKALKIAVVADLAFVYFGKLTETQNGETFENTESVGIEAELLYETLGAMLRRSDREAQAMANKGEIQGDDTRIALEYVPGISVGIRKRA